VDDVQRAQVLSAVGYATGVAGGVAPGLVAKVFGITTNGGEFESTVRMMSFRNVALAAVMSAVSDDEVQRKRFFKIAAAMFAADTVTAAISAMTGKISPRTASMLGVTTAALAAIAASGSTGGQ
jgi:hypothetical protein